MCFLFFSLNSFIMPRSDRSKKEQQKKLYEASKAAGQTKIANFFKTVKDDTSGATTSQSTVTDKQATSEQNSETQDTELEQEPGSGGSVGLTNPWVKKYSDFSAEDKKKSVRNGRFFQAEWLKTHQWLWYNREQHAAYCEVCTQFNHPRDTSSFVFHSASTGFRNWKKGVERLADHEKSENHKAAAKSARKVFPDIDSQLDDRLRQEQKLRRQGLISHLDTMKTLLRQGLPIRGHTDENSNITQFNKDKAIHDVGLKRFLDEGRFFSHEILSEQEQSLVLEAKRTLVNEINRCDFYSVICDESSDISKIEQLSFSVRHCSDTYDIKEDFTGVMPCDKGLSSEALLAYVNDILIRCNMDKEKMIGMSFDGASSMKLLAKLIKQDANHHVLYIHCFAHCNELVFKDATSLSPLIANSQDLCEALYALVGVSPKRVLLFENIQKEIDCDDGVVLRLQNLSRTRWTTRGSAADVITKRHTELQEVLLQLSTDTSASPECRAKARGLLMKIQSFSDMFNVMVMQELAYLLEGNSRHLQSSTDRRTSNVSIKRLYIRLQELRSDEEFERLYDRVEGLSGLKHDDDIAPKRKRSLPGRMADFVAYESRHAPVEDPTMGEKSKLWINFYAAIDATTQAIESRFDQEDLKVLRDIDECLIKGANGESNALEVKRKLANLSTSVNLDTLSEELQELPVHIKIYNKETSVVPIRKVTKVSTICDVLTEKQSSKECLPEVHKLLKLYNSVPLVSATAERTFSVMRRLKSWLRSTLTANSLNNKMFASIHRDRMDDVSSEKIAREFVANSQERRNYFGRF